ncbi:MAG: hypothetical protein KY459_10490 [Acidobacteria bacterium]|nr:hypothetical protein [Acidobacteriota bacterium]
MSELLGSSPEQLKARILSDEAPEDFQMLVARGFLPVAQEDMIPILIHLGRSPNESIAKQARSSLGEAPRGSIQSFAEDESSPPAVLGDLAVVTEDRAVLEKLVRNRATPAEAISSLARKADARLQEAIVTNQRRILEQPEILESLEANPSLTGDTKRRIREFREEFFEKEQARRDARERRAAEEAELAAEAQRELDEILAKVEDDRPKEETLQGAPPGVSEATEDDPDENLSAWVRILKMSVSERVRTAFKAGKTERTILIRDRNRLVCTAVIRSPRITETEVEAYAAMRNIDGEVLRLIGMNREWMRKYPIMMSLIKNPKAPPGVVLPLVNRLTLRDLKGLSTDKGVPDVIRVSARRLFNQKTRK